MRLTTQQIHAVRTSIKTTLDNEHNFYGPLSDRSLWIVTRSETGLDLLRATQVSYYRNQLGYQHARQRAKTTKYAKALD